jgi:hypothetical protein
VEPYYQDEWTTIYCADCREVLPTLGQLELILTDPPYPSEFFESWRTLAEYSFDILKDGASLVTLLGHYQLPDVIGLFSQTRLRYWWIAGMRQTSITRMIGKNVNINWKPALWYVRGKLRRDISTAWPQDMITPRKPEKSLHPGQQAESWFSHWIEQLTLPGEIVIDPFMGSGTTLVAAKELKRKSIGMEIDEKYCKIAVDRLRQGILLAS